MGHVPYFNHMIRLWNDEKGKLIVIDNLPSNKLNFIKETTMRGDNVILKKI